MTIDFSNKTINEIIGMKDEQDEEIFSTQSEKALLNDIRINGDDEKAREVAKLFVEVKKGEKATSKDENLFELLREEIEKDTLAYQVVNSLDERVDKVFERVSKLWKKQDKDDKKDKKEIETEIANLKLIERENFALLAEKKTRKRALISRRNKKRTEERNELKNAERKKTLFAILKYSKDPVPNGNDDVEITLKNGSKQKISAVILNCTTNKLVRDYSNQKTSGLAINTGTYAITGATTAAGDDGLLKFDNDGKVDAAYYADNTNLGTLLSNSYKFLDQMFDTSIIATVATGNVPQYLAYDLPDNYNGRKYASKNEISSDDDGYGNTFLKVLRTVGAKALKDAIDDSSLTLSAADKKKMKEYVEQITDYINTAEVIGGKDFDATAPEFDSVAFDKKVNEATKNYPNLKNTEYPYREIPDYEKIIEFMKKVLPRNNNSLKYLNDPTSSIFLKPSGGKND